MSTDTDDLQPEEKIFVLEVFLRSAPVTEEFQKAHPEVSRTIQIRGDQTLADLHDAIFAAYDRFEEHLYEFQFPKGPTGDEADRYQPPKPKSLGGAFFEDFGDEPGTKDTSTTTIASLNLQPQTAFGYWFDFGDDWFHQVDVLAIEEADSSEDYPKVIDRTGDSPPQYPDLEDM